jgi:hypothetical protein
MKQHRADLVSLFFALVFLTVAGWWAITYLYDIQLNVPNFGWFAAGALILVGVLASWRAFVATAPTAPTRWTRSSPSGSRPGQPDHGRDDPGLADRPAEPADRTPAEPPTAPGDEVPRDDTSGERRPASLRASRHATAPTMTSPSWRRCRVSGTGPPDRVGGRAPMLALAVRSTLPVRSTMEKEPA